MTETARDSGSDTYDVIVVGLGPGGEHVALKLGEAGLRVLPGAYMARPDAEGRNPGAPYIRVALVHEPEIVEEGLTRLVRVLAPDSRDDAAAAQ